MDKTINKKPIFFIGVYLCLSAIALFSGSCAEMARDMGIDGATDVQLRSGLTGTQNNPASLDPFKRYDLVMTANETRFFSMKVPAGWYWKVYVTAASRRENDEGRLSAVIAQTDPPWTPLDGTSFDKSMDLKNDGDQALLAVGNSVQTRYALLRLSQEGAPVYVTIESQVSTTANLLGPSPNNSGLQGLSQ